MVKRYGYLWDRICSEENILAAYKEARKGRKRAGPTEVDADPAPFLAEVRHLLVTHEYRSGTYRSFTVCERGKERVVCDIGFFPDRIVHWALMLVIRPILMNSIGEHSYAAMKGRGTHMALKRLDEYMRGDPDGTRYCLKTDIKQFFPSIDKDRLMEKLERRIKDPDVLWLCSEIIHGYDGPGLPIGNYTSQYFANFYLADLDREMKQVFHCKHYLRYMDDVIILGSSKSWLRRARKRMLKVLERDGLEMKSNWQIFPVESRGVDFVGYRTFHGFRLLRRRTKVRMRAACARIRAKLAAGGTLDAHDRGCLASYHGILGWCDGHRLESVTIGPLMGIMRGCPMALSFPVAYSKT